MHEDEQKQYWLKASSTLAISIEDEYSSFDYQYRRLLLPHIDACLKHHTDKLFAEGDTHKQRLDMASRFALVYKEAGQFERELQLRERIVEGL